MCQAQPKRENTNNSIQMSIREPLLSRSPSCRRLSATRMKCFKVEVALTASPVPKGEIRFLKLLCII